MQEMLEWVRATLPMDLDWPMLIEKKVKSLIPKEKEVILDAFSSGEHQQGFEGEAEKYYNKNFNTK